ncbi:hypothetical protein ABH926_009226 [Catenulispora sp. GP43]|uniref:HalD/BesD family halogenase n=1 Tax=Catenulispora sp. GP43 TaxID=3156263 RepID=UPI0035113EF2
MSSTETKVVSTVAVDIERHVSRATSSSNLLSEARQEFILKGRAKLSELFPRSVKELMAEEVLRVVGLSSVRRDISFKETDYSPRRMRNVDYSEIAKISEIIPTIYGLSAIIDLLSVVAGEQVFPCPYEPERYVITSLDQEGDTHGWHWDDYSFALVWVAECPPVADGGFVQCVPGTVWNKADPQINRVLAENPIYSLAVGQGDIYLMKTDTSLHRVYPITGGRRSIINMGYAAQADFEKNISHETMDGLWQMS